MILKEANTEDIKKEYFCITNLKDVNGFTNPDYGCTFEQFQNEVLPRYIRYSKGIHLPEGYVPSTEFFIWEKDEIIGIIRIRHHLNDFLRNGAGHIGYVIKEEYRGKHLASNALALAIQKAKEIIPEDEIYLSCRKNNKASLQVMMNNGAYIHHEDENEYYTRIRIRKILIF